MRAAIRAMSLKSPRSPKIDFGETEEPLQLTLLELVQAVSDVTDSDLEAVVAVRYLLETGRVSLCGSFQHTPVSSFF